MPSSDSGATLLELLVASALGLLVIGLVLSIVLGQRALVLEDQQRIRLSENLRSALDVVSLRLRRAGEKLPADVPVLALENGGATQPDSLTIQRNSVQAVLPVCKELKAGRIMIYTTADPAPLPGCTGTLPPAVDEPTEQWLEYFYAQGNPEVRIYIYNPSTQEGEFLAWHNPDVFRTRRRFKLREGPLATYPVGSRVYAIESERIFVDSLQEELLLEIDGAKDLSIKKLMFGVTDFQVRLELSNGATLEEFDPMLSPFQWVDIVAVSIEIHGRMDVRGEPIERTLKGRFFPRNSLSY